MIGFDSWDEIRTAFQVARVGTVSGAAEVLGVHHATVIRHVDALEDKLGAKLFQRHPRGYTPTEAGQQLLSVGQATEDQFAQLSARIAGAGEEVSGELIVTSLTSVSVLVLPAMERLLGEYPGLRLSYLTDHRVFRLENGEAHVAIRAGNRPTEPDNVVQSLGSMQNALYASHAYVERYGVPRSKEELAQHRFVSIDNRESRAPFYRWLSENVPDEQVVFRANDHEAQVAAIKEGLGVGFLTVPMGRGDPKLEEIVKPYDTWNTDLWLVTHVDLHRTPKVQAAVKAIKEQAARSEGLVAH
ncbi:DNA-binding transcriptional regulator, LysR family [Thioclava dalianensis]|uniref:LysR family transcriptional regulator n=1 Tax=Thioclava dalianensis TaxID=1185766 RepID=UPI000570AF0F|nr:LysR family transcriptional regulator [Thioclava dalianensis]SFM86891.1 DNA-binding transcriptional regulator, LysR family [Thioclava dalianensis]